MSVFSFLRNPHKRQAPGTVPSMANSDTIFNFPWMSINPTSEACIRKITSTLASLKIQLYSHRKGGGRAIVFSHPLAYALKNPDPSTTPIQFYAALIDDILRGNAYIRYTRAGDVLLFEKLEAKSVNLTIEQGRKVYIYGGNRFTDKEILHIPYPFSTTKISPSFAAQKGVSPYDYYSELIALDNAMAAYMKMYFGNSVGKRTVLELGDRWNEKKIDEAYQLLAPAVQKYVYGAANQGKPIIPPPGTKLSTIDQTQNLYADIKSLKEHIERQIAQGWGVPYSLISEVNKYNSLEANQLQFLADTIEPLGTHIEQSFNRLLSPDESALYCKYDYKAMLQSDIKTTVEYLSKEVSGGLLTINEARDRLDLEAVEAGDYTFVPANLWPLTVENVKAFFAQSKLAQHINAGDDKQ